jgi:hypothetical protein
MNNHINSQVFYYHHNAKTCFLRLVLFDYNHFSNRLKNRLCHFFCCFSHCNRIRQVVQNIFWHCTWNGTSSCCEITSHYFRPKSQG